MRLMTQLEAARNMQEILVPPVRYRTRGIDLYGRSLPSDQVGGDLVDIDASSSELFAYVADISGHGLQAGILMGMLKASIRTILLVQPSLPRMLEGLNAVLPGLKEQHMYTTFAALRLHKDRD